MTEKLLKCRKPSCWINDLVDRGYVAMWPLSFHPEPHKGYHEWNFHISWTENVKTKANRRSICPGHHRELLHLHTTETLMDRREQEATEQWLVKTRSRM